MIRHICYIIIFLCLHFSAFAEVANKIEVVGNDRVSDSSDKSLRGYRSQQKE